ncbi:MAG: Crp/Fnr family transcriptional regulator [Panacibacter sp.]
MNLREKFPQLEPALLDEIEREGMIKEFASGDVLMRTGQYIKSTVLILEGIVKIFRKDEEGSEFLMYYLQPGEACAISIICASKAETSKISAVAMEDSIALMVPIKFMDEWMSKYKSWYYFVLETYRNRFEELLIVIDNVAFRNMDERLFFYLKRYTETNHSNSIALSHQQIADELNSSREVISRLLKKMEQRGLVTLNRNFIELHAGAVL